MVDHCIALESTCTVPVRPYRARELQQQPLSWRFQRSPEGERPASRDFCFTWPPAVAALYSTGWAHVGFLQFHHYSDSETIGRLGCCARSLACRRPATLLFGRRTALFEVSVQYRGVWDCSALRFSASLHVLALRTQFEEKGWSCEST